MTALAPNRPSTKERIVEAAIELIAQYGYEGASMRKIAKVVGVRESAIYNHFENKEAIYNTILQKMFSSYIDDFFIERSFEECAKDGKKFLIDLALRFKSYLKNERNKKFFQIILQELVRDKKVRERFLESFYSKNIRKLSSIFLIMMQEELIRPGDPILMAREFFAPLLYHTIEATLLELDQKPLNFLENIFEKHVEFFWESVAL